MEPRKLEVASLSQCPRLDDNIGSGSFGVIRVVEHPYGQLMAVKTFPPMIYSSDGRPKFKFSLQERYRNCWEEFNAGSSLQPHPNILPLYQMFPTQQPVSEQEEVCFTMEYMRGGTLLDYINRKKQGISFVLARTFLDKILAGVESIHCQGYCHRDFKPENIGLTTDGEIKILDFGFLTKEENITEQKGAQIYKSLEMLKKDTYGSRVTDIWAIGVTLFILCVYGFPFGEQNDTNKILSVYETFRSNNKQFWSDHKSNTRFTDRYSNQFTAFKQLIDGMFYPDPGNRIQTVSQIRESKWFKGPRMSPENYKNFMTPIVKQLFYKRFPQMESMYTHSTKIFTLSTREIFQEDSPHSKTARSNSKATFHSKHPAFCEMLRTTKQFIGSFQQTIDRFNNGVSSTKLVISKIEGSQHIILKVQYTNRLKENITRDVRIELKENGDRLLIQLRQDEDEPMQFEQLAIIRDLIEKAESASE